MSGVDKKYNNALVDTLPGDIDAYMPIFPNVREVTLNFPRGYASLDPKFQKGVRKYYSGREWSSPYVRS